MVLSACAKPPQQKESLPPPSGVSAEVEPSEAEVLHRGLAAYEKRDFSSAVTTLNRFLLGRPDHLEARVILAMTHEAAGEKNDAAETWSRVEKILVYQGKVAPFAEQAALSGAALHYLQLEKKERGRLFLDELWRRFPMGQWAPATQLTWAESEHKAARWSQAIAVCGELTRIRPTHPASTRCQSLSRAARRLLEVGPPPARDAPAWIWDHPLPQGNTLYDVWESPKGEVIAVGEAGTILRRGPRDRTFSLVRSPTRWALRRLWGAGTESLYAAGAAGVILHYDGKEWRIIREPAAEQADLWGIFAGEAGPTVAVGEGGVVVEGGRDRWSERRVTEVSLRGVWGDGGRVLYAVGDGGELLRSSEGRWQRLASDCYEDLWGLWGASETHLIAVGNRRTVVRFDGERAKEQIVGRTHFRDVSGTGPGHVFAVGTSGDIAHYAGKDWRSEDSGTVSDLYGVAGRGPDEVWAVGEGGTILKRQGSRWMTLAGGVQQTLVAVRAGGYALGDRGLMLRRNGGRWEAEPALPPGRYHDLWFDAGRMVAVGDRGVMVGRTGRGAWSVIPSGTPEDLVSVWGWGGGFVVVGTRGTILRVLGDKVVKDEPPTGLDLRAVWGASSRSLLAVGTRGTILRFDGEKWAEEESGTLADLNAVWGSSPESAMVAGAGGVVLKLTRGRWRPLTAPFSQDVVGLWGSESRGYFAITKQGVIAHHDGERWQIQRSPAACLRAVDGDPVSGAVLAAGCHGSILRLGRAAR
jgi:hypothetical protein